MRRCGGAGHERAPGGRARTGADGAELALQLTPRPSWMEELVTGRRRPARRLFSTCRRALDGLEMEGPCPRLAALTDQLPVHRRAKRALNPLGGAGAMTGGDSRRPSPG